MMQLFLKAVILTGLMFGMLTFAGCFTPRTAMSVSYHHASEKGDEFWMTIQKTEEGKGQVLSLWYCSPGGGSSPKCREAKLISCSGKNCSFEVTGGILEVLLDAEKK